MINRSYLLEFSRDSLWVKSHRWWWWCRCCCCCCWPVQFRFFDVSVVSFGKWVCCFTGRCLCVRRFQSGVALSRVQPGIAVLWIYNTRTSYAGRICRNLSLSFDSRHSETWRCCSTKCFIIFYLYSQEWCCLFICRANNHSGIRDSIICLIHVNLSIAYHNTHRFS